MFSFFGQLVKHAKNQGANKTKKKTLIVLSKHTQKHITTHNDTCQKRLVKQKEEENRHHRPI